MGHEDRYKAIPACYLILDRDDKLLLARRCNTGYEDGNYGLVAGHAEADETLVATLRREIEEEVGIKLNPDSIDLVLTMHRHCGDHQRFDFFFTASDYEGEIVNNEPHKCDDMSWFANDDLPENTIPYIRQALECYSQGICYNEFNWPEN